MVSSKIIRQNMLWYTAGSSFYMFAMWMITVLVVRISGYSAAGLLSLAMSATNVLYTISIWGMRSYQVSDMEGQFSDATYVASRVMTSMTALVACLIFMYFNSYDRQQRLCILLYMLFRISEAFSDVFGGILQKHWRLDIVGRSYVFRGFLMVVSFSLVLLTTKNLPLALLIMFIFSLAVVLSYDINRTIRISQLNMEYRFNDIGRLLYQCAPLVISNFLYTLNAFIPRYYLEQYEGESVLGIYASIAAPVLIVQLLSSFVFSPLIPLFSQHHQNQDKKAFKALFIKVTAFVMIIAILSLFGGFLMGDFLLSLLFGQDILEYASILTLVIVSVISTTFIWLLNGVITALRNVRFLMFCAMAGSVTSMVIAKSTVHALGMNGVSVVLIAAQVLQILLMTASVIYYLKSGGDRLKQAP